MLKGILVTGRRTMPTAEVLAEAERIGHVDGYPLTVLAQMLSAYRTKAPSASQIASSTWRRMVLERLVDYYAWPSALLPMARGSFIHKGLEGVPLPKGVKVIKEKRLTMPLPSHKEVTISGQIDVYYPTARRLEDYKTAMSIPSVIKEEHIFQLAVYGWLLRWAGYTVDSAVINYIAWSEMKQVGVTEGTPRSVLIPAAEHPYFQDQGLFEGRIAQGWHVLNDGFEHGLVPSMQDCNINYCRNCPLKWVCDQVDVEGEVIDGSAFKQEDYM